MPARMICELKAPARPRSAVISSSATRCSDSCCLRIGNVPISPPAASAACRVMRRMAPAYGRRCSMRCSARRRRAAATISIARVILRMFWTEAIRFLTSRCDMCQGSAWPLRGGAGRLRLCLGLLADVSPRPARPIARGTRLDAVGLALRQRLALLVEVVAEVVGERGDQVAQRLLGLVGPVASADLVEQLGVLGAHALREALE